MVWPKFDGHKGVQDLVRVFCNRSMHDVQHMLNQGKSHTEITQVLEEYLSKENEVLETGIQVSFSLELTYLVKMGAIDVGIHTEEALEYLLHNFFEIVRERGSNGTRECFAIINLRVQHFSAATYFTAP